MSSDPVAILAERAGIPDRRRRGCPSPPVPHTPTSRRPQRQMKTGGDRDAAISPMAQRCDDAILIRSCSGSHRERAVKQTIATMALVVRDYDEALAFYVGTLG